MGRITRAFMELENVLTAYKSENRDLRQQLQAERDKMTALIEELRKEPNLEFVTSRSGKTFAMGLLAYHRKVNDLLEKYERTNG